MVTLFHEEQRFNQWWIWLIIGIAVVIQWWAFVQQIFLERPFGTNPASDWLLTIFWLLFGIGLPLFFLYLKLIVEVTNEAVEIRFRPISKRTIPIGDIVHVEARTYSPLREYGGWGVRGAGNNKAYNVSGNRGVQLRLQNGQAVMIGSQRADELAEIIEEAVR